jgi:hypothetical protein
MPCLESKRLESHMIKRFLPLVLMFAWIPAAMAFPPCPRAPIQQTPQTQVAATSGMPAWFQVSYFMDGAPYIVNELRAGKCRDRIPVPASNASNGIIAMTPNLSPINGVGTVVLPEFPTSAANGLHLPYRLDFTIDNAPLLNSGDWMDVAELNFARDRGLTASGWPLSSVYRVRKVQRGSGPIVQVIESRAHIEDDTGESVTTDSVVAEIPLTGAGGNTAIALRWTQHAQQPVVSEPDASAAPFYYVDSTMEVLGQIRQAMVGVKPNDVMYSTALPRQWCDALKMGLLDYNASIRGQPYGINFRVDVNKIELSVELPGNTLTAP